VFAEAMHETHLNTSHIIGGVRGGRGSQPATKHHTFTVSLSPNQPGNASEAIAINFATLTDRVMQNPIRP
jgi:hypothetical protein